MNKVLKKISYFFLWVQKPNGSHKGCKENIYLSIEEVIKRYEELSSR